MPSKIVLSEECLDQIRKDFSENISLKDLAKKYNMSVMTLRPIIKNMGLKRLGRITDETVKEVLSLRDKHLAFIRQ